MPEDIEKKTAFIGYKAKPSQKERVTSAVERKLVPDVRNVSEFVEHFVERGLNEVDPPEAS